MQDEFPEEGAIDPQELSSVHDPLSDDDRDDDDRDDSDKEDSDGDEEDDDDMILEKIGAMVTKNMRNREVMVMGQVVITWARPSMMLNSLISLIFPSLGTLLKKILR